MPAAVARCSAWRRGRRTRRWLREWAARGPGTPATGRRPRSGRRRAGPPPRARPPPEHVSVARPPRDRVPARRVPRARVSVARVPLVGSPSGAVPWGPAGPDVRAATVGVGPAAVDARPTAGHPPDPRAGTAPTAVPSQGAARWRAARPASGAAAGGAGRPAGTGRPGPAACPAPPTAAAGAAGSTVADPTRARPAARRAAAYPAAVTRARPRAARVRAAGRAGRPAAVVADRRAAPGRPRPATLRHARVSAAPVAGRGAVAAGAAPPSTVGAAHRRVAPVRPAGFEVAARPVEGVAPGARAGEAARPQAPSCPARPEARRPVDGPAVIGRADPGPAGAGRWRARPTPARPTSASRAGRDVVRVVPAVGAGPAVVVAGAPVAGRARRARATPAVAGRAPAGRRRVAAPGRRAVAGPRPAPARASCPGRPARDGCRVPAIRCPDRVARRARRSGRGDAPVAAVSPGRWVRWSAARWGRGATAGARPAVPTGAPGRRAGRAGPLRGWSACRRGPGPPPSGSPSAAGRPCGRQSRGGHLAPEELTVRGRPAAVVAPRQACGRSSKEVIGVAFVTATAARPAAHPAWLKADKSRVGPTTRPPLRHTRSGYRRRRRARYRHESRPTVRSGTRCRR